MTNDLPAGSILGIWRIGDSVATAIRPGRDLTTQTYAAQPADSVGSNRWNYRLTVGADTPAVRSAFDCFSRSAATNHPNLIPLLDSSVDASTPYIVTANTPGIDWMQRQNDAIQTLPVVLWVVRQATMATSALHSAGWIHGRIDPSAILVQPDGTAMLNDLSFASSIHSNRRMVRAAQPPFAAPEMLTGDHAAIPAMDVYSLGQVLFDSLGRTGANANSKTVIQTADLIESMVDPTADRRPTAAAVAKRLLHLEMQSLSEHFGPSGLMPALPLAA